MVVSLLCQWAQHPCGTPTNIVTVSGAGLAAANQDYLSNGPTQWIGIHDVTFLIQFVGGRWVLSSIDDGDQYYSLSDEFPCFWRLEDGGTAPVPIGSYAPGRWYFSNQTVAPNTSFAIGFEGAGTRIVDWGDGSSSTSSGTLVVTHVYAVSAGYKFSVRESSGTTTRMYFYNLAGSTLLKSILSPPYGMTGLNSLLNAFANCTGLTGLIPDLSNLVNLTTLNATFYQCTGLTGSIPSLNAFTKLTDLGYFVYGCTHLTGSVPSLSNLINLTSLEKTFNSCGGLTGSIPSLSSLSALTDFLGTFRNCSGLTGPIPDLSGLVNVTALTNTFKVCPGLTGSIPSLPPNLTDLNSAFYGCSGLTGSIPILSTFTNLTTLTSAFYGCTGLAANTATIAQIFGAVGFPHLTSASYCFFLVNAANSYLKGNAADFISLPKSPGFVVDGAGSGSDNMFHNQTTLTDYTTIAAAWK